MFHYDVPFAVKALFSLQEDKTVSSLYGPAPTPDTHAMFGTMSILCLLA